MKYILAIWHKAGKGKSDIVRQLANLILQQYPTYKPIYPNPASVPTKDDFRLVIEINGRKIGFESKGDPNTNLPIRLDELARQFQCDVIICTTRTGGATLKAVDNIADNYGHYTVYTSTYETVDKDINHSIVNKIKAEHLMNLLQQLGVL